MLAYAANRPDPAGRRSSPNVMLVILVAHIAAIAALMSAKMDLPRRIVDHTPLIRVPIDQPPQPIRHEPTKPTAQPRNQWITQPKTQTSPQPIPQPPVDHGPTTVDPGPIVGPVTDPGPVQPIPLPLPVKIGPTLLTPAPQLRPPYPEAKLLNEEEADLHLRLTIGADGRVTAVDSVGRADVVFLEAARSYLIGHWRYRPATIDGRPVPTTTVITLSFRLDG